MVPLSPYPAIVARLEEIAQGKAHFDSPRVQTTFTSKAPTTLYRPNLPRHPYFDTLPEDNCANLQPIDSDDEELSLLANGVDSVADGLKLRTHNHSGFRNNMPSLKVCS
jgi:hypothetical protein